MLAPSSVSASIHARKCNIDFPICVYIEQSYRYRGSHRLFVYIFFSLFSLDITHIGGKFALTGNTVSQRQCDNNVTCHRGEGLGSGNVLALSGFPTIDCCYTQATEMLFTLFTKRKPLTLSANWIGCCRQFIDGRRGCNLQFSKIIGGVVTGKQKSVHLCPCQAGETEGLPSV